MPIPVREQIPTEDASFCIEVTDDGSRTLLLDGVRYHSGCGAISECDWVYVRGGGMTDAVDEHWPHRILEVGFGTGMAMLRTIDRALSAGQTMDYVALENSPIRVEILEELQLDRIMQNPERVRHFLDQWNHCLRSPVRSNQFSIMWGADVKTTVLFSEAAEWIAHRSTESERPFDTVYFDPFDPQVNAELWRQEVLQGLGQLLKPGGRLVTYCVQGEVRRALRRVGFDPKRVQGPPGGKREVLIATRTS